MPSPRAIVLRAPGTNCDEETVAAWRMAGAEVDTVHVDRVLERPEALDAFQILTIPGGFSYGDDLGAGRILASRIGALDDALRRFHDRGGLILGICNGFQVLVKAGLLPGGHRATITHNDSGRFECRWVRLAVTSQGRSPFLPEGGPIELPVAHGEGKFVAESEAALGALDDAGQLALRYVDGAGLPTEAFPGNPNGAPRGVAGVVDPTGRIFGLMPHPERFVEFIQHPRWTRLPDRPEGDGLRIFRGAVAATR
ncbi:phosphoribosylformylglycinamidine synthase I [Tautonia plasticadhaerens]|uniref:Phosphoribosylformylglycinamidine synthase subunit PurQ n=1 Tax=Tautonia plasticadhaerens TaxID=2527974 RepID=A0A518HB52_9BACT|nr:phosphoribosylformylglycinamidine synthase I [Tautonia plasticadhaerens]QDV38069.1 Phosphoribosylformylglycinamidine synthase [Tautonia plasticadhaerens]